MRFIQSCDSKECLKLEKERVAVKNIDVVTRPHEYDEKTNEIKCLACGKISYANETKELIKEKKEIAKRVEKIEREIEKSENQLIKTKIEPKRIEKSPINGKLIKSKLKRNTIIFKTPI